MKLNAKKYAVSHTVQDREIVYSKGVVLDHILKRIADELAREIVKEMTAAVRLGSMSRGGIGGHALVRDFDASRTFTLETLLVDPAQAKEVEVALETNEALRIHIKKQDGELMRLRAIEAKHNRLVANLKDVMAHTRGVA